MAVIHVVRVIVPALVIAAIGQRVSRRMLAGRVGVAESGNPAGYAATVRGIGARLGAVTRSLRDAVARRMEAIPAWWRAISGAEADVDIDAGSVRFEWRTRVGDQVGIRSGLETAGIEFQEASPLRDDRLDLVTEDVEAAGIHLDQESKTSTPVLTPTVRYVGTASPRRLVNAVANVLGEGRTGFVVNTVGERVEIDEHQSVGSGVIVVVDADGVRQLRSGTNRALLQAIQASAERAEHSSPPVPNLAS